MRIIIIGLLISLGFTLPAQPLVTEESTFEFMDNQWRKTMEISYQYDSDTNLVYEEHSAREQHKWQVYKEVWYNEQGLKSEEKFLSSPIDFLRYVYQYDSQGIRMGQDEYRQSAQVPEQLIRKMTGEYVEGCNILYRHYELGPTGKLQFSFATVSLHDQHCEWIDDRYLSAAAIDTAQLKEHIPSLITTSEQQPNGQRIETIQEVSCATCVDTFTISRSIMDIYGNLIHHARQDCRDCSKTITNYEYFVEGGYKMIAHHFVYAANQPQLNSITEKEFDVANRLLQEYSYSPTTQNTLEYEYDNKGKIDQIYTEWISKDSTAINQFDFITAYDYQYYCDSLLLAVTTSYSNNTYKTRKEYNYLEDVTPCATETSDLHQIQIHPTVATDRVFIKSEVNAATTPILILNQQGQIMKQFQSQIGLATSLDISDIPAGAYFIYLPELKINEKLIVTK